MVGWEVPIGAAIAFAQVHLQQDGHNHGLVQPEQEPLQKSLETAGSIIIIEAIPETLVILGFVIASMIILMVK